MIFIRYRFCRSSLIPSRGREFYAYMWETIFLKVLAAETRVLLKTLHSKNELESTLIPQVVRKLSEARYTCVESNELKRSGKGISSTEHRRNSTEIKQRGLHQGSGAFLSVPQLSCLTNGATMWMKQHRNQSTISQGLLKRLHYNYDSTMKFPK